MPQRNPPRGRRYQEALRILRVPGVSSRSRALSYIGWERMNGRTGWWGALLAALALALAGGSPGPVIPGRAPVPPAAPVPAAPQSPTALRTDDHPAWPASIRQGPIPLELVSDGGSRGPWPHSRSCGGGRWKFVHEATLRAASRARAADLAYLDYSLRLARARAGLPIPRSTAPPPGV